MQMVFSYPALDALHKRAFLKRAAMAPMGHDRSACSGQGIPLLDRGNAFLLFHTLLDTFNGVRRLNVNLNLLARQRLHLDHHAPPVDIHHPSLKISKDI